MISVDLKQRHSDELVTVITVLDPVNLKSETYL